MELKTKSKGNDAMKQVKIGAIYHQMAQEKSKKKGQHIESYLNDLIAADYQKKK
jgi:hypothetical protein